MIVFDQIFGPKSSSKVVYKLMLTELVSRCGWSAELVDE